MDKEVVDGSALSLKSCDVGAFKTLVRIPQTYPGWQDVSIEDAEVVNVDANHERKP